MHVTETLFYCLNEDERIQLTEPKVISDYYLLSGKYENDSVVLQGFIDGYSSAKGYISMNNENTPKFPFISLELSIWDEDTPKDGEIFIVNNYDIFYQEVIKKCVSLLSEHGSNTKELVRLILQTIMSNKEFL